MELSWEGQTAISYNRKTATFLAIKGSCNMKYIINLSLWWGDDKFKTSSSIEMIYAINIKNVCHTRCIFNETLF